MNKKTDICQSKKSLQLSWIRHLSYFVWEAIDDWYIARNDAFHEGTEKLPTDLLAKRGKHIRDFASLVFVEMLQQQEDANRKEIATRINNY